MAQLATVSDPALSVVARSIDRACCVYSSLRLDEICATISR